MKYTAIQFLQTPLKMASQCLVFIGNNRWLKKQIRTKIEGSFGRPLMISADDEEGIKHTADIISRQPLQGSGKQFVWLMDANADLIYKWLNSINITKEGTIFCIELSEKKVDKRIFQSQIKNLSKYDKNKTISYIDAQDPAGPVVVKIIEKILSAANITDAKIVKQFFREYGADFDSSEENAKKISLNGKYNNLLIDKKDVSMKEVWSVVDRWVDNKLEDSLLLVDLVEQNGFSPYAVHSQVSRQFRTYLVAVETSRGHPAIVSKAQNIDKVWAEKAYNELVKINPMQIAYFDMLRLCITKTFIAQF